MADKIIENLITQLSFKYDQKDVSKFNASIKTVVKSVLGVTAAVGTAAAGIFAFTKSVAESNDKLGKFSQRTGVDVEALQELGYVAELNGGSINSMNSSLENLSKITSEAARGVGAGVEVFGMLGLSATDAEGQVKSADSMLMEISDSIAGLGSQAEKLEFSQKLGLGSDLLLSLENGSDAIRQQRQEAQALGFAFDKDAAGAAANFNDELLRVGKIIKGVSSVIGTKLMKVITPMIKVFTDWYKINRALIKQGLDLFFKKVASVATTLYNVGLRVYAVVDNIVQAFGGWKNIIIGVTGVLMVLNATAILIPVLLAGIGAAIFLLIEDLQKFQQGGDSAIGSLLEKFPLLQESLHLLLDWIGMIGKGWALIFSDGGNALEGLVMMLTDGINILKDFWGQVEAVGALIVSKFMTPIRTGIELLNKIPGVNISAGGPVPTAAAGSTGATNTTSNTTNNSSPEIKISINGGNTANVRKTIEDVLTNQYKGAQQNLATNVEY